MTRRIPLVHNGAKILIICEGYEEYDYLKRLKSLRVWDENFCIKVENAKSIDNIFAMYQYEYANNNYKLILIFCDTEMHPYEQFVTLKMQIDGMHGNKASNKILFFCNPCTMQIVLSHFDKVRLKTNSKSKNGKLIKNLVGICGYMAKEKQREQLMQKINESNYRTMKNNLVGISDDCKDVPSTNILDLFNNLEVYNKGWITNINESIEE